MFICEFGYILKMFEFNTDHVKQNRLPCNGNRQERAKVYIWAIFIETLQLWSFDIITQIQ